MSIDFTILQECIPVGCIPPAAVAVCWGVYLSAYWETPWLCAWNPPPSDGLETPLRCGPGDPQGKTPQLPPGVGLETPPGQTPQLLACVWVWRPARHAGIPLPSPVDRQTRVKT